MAWTGDRRLPPECRTPTLFTHLLSQRLQVSFSPLLATEPSGGISFSTLRWRLNSILKFVLRVFSHFHKFGPRDPTYFIAQGAKLNQTIYTRFGLNSKR